MPHAVKALATIAALTIAIPSGFPIVYRLNAQDSAPVATPGYVALARLADASPLVMRVQVKKTTVVEPERAPDVAPGMARLFVEAQVLNLIRGKSGVSESIRYLVDVPRDSRGKVPKLKKAQFLLFARPGSRPGEIQLVAKDGQIAWSAANEAQVRTIVTDLVTPGAPLPFAAFAKHCTCAAIFRAKAKRRSFWPRPMVTPCRLPCCAVRASPRAGRSR